MKRRPVVPRAAAIQDVDDAVAWYLHDGSAQAALDVLDALERAYDHLGRHPATGSNRHAYALDLPGLRSWPLDRFPYLVFYVEHGGRIDVWRVLHAERDVPREMLER